MSVVGEARPYGGYANEEDRPIEQPILFTTPTRIPSSSETSPTAGAKGLGLSLPLDRCKAKIPRADALDRVRNRVSSQGISVKA